MSQSMPPNYDERNREESISARVYREIKNKILQLDYLPGSYLTEARLAEEYGVSRMPVRIAIQKLSSEGWLLSDFRRKLRVKDVTQKSVQDLFSFREIIETRALQKIFEDDRTWEYSFLIEQKLLRMRAARDNYYEYMVADAEMHFELSPSLTTTASRTSTTPSATSSCASISCSARLSRATSISASKSSSPPSATRTTTPRITTSSATTSAPPSAAIPLPSRWKNTSPSCAPRRTESRLQTHRPAGIPLPRPAVRFYAARHVFRRRGIYCPMERKAGGAP